MNKNCFNVPPVILWAVTKPARWFINKARVRDKQLFADSGIPTQRVSPFRRQKTINARIVMCVWN